MTFFCSKCQTRHDAHDISADMWSICRDTIKDGTVEVLKELISGTEDESRLRQLNDLFNDLIRMINTTEPKIRVGDGLQKTVRINGFFALNRNNVQDLANVKKKEENQYGSSVCGDYTVRFGTLLRVYDKWDQSNATTDCVPADWYDRVVCVQPLIASFNENGVLDTVSGLDHVPFSQYGKMLGFVHICPHCGCVLSRASGAAPEIVVALAGSPRAGKTSCMVAMFHALQQGSCPGIQIVPVPHDEKWKVLQKEIDNYASCYKVEKTPDNDTEVPAHSVLIQIGDRNDHLRVLTIVDMAGEFWEGGSGLSDRFFEDYAGIYEHIDCIWYVISKATVLLSQAAIIPETVNQKLIEHVSEDKDIILKSKPEQLSNNLNMLQKHLKKRMPPIMVIVSKPDHMISELDRQKTSQFQLFPVEEDNAALCNAEDLQMTVGSDRNQRHYIRQRPLRSHADNVREFIADVAPSYLNAIERNCPDRFYTALAPYGRPATDKDEPSVGAPIPYHELYPILWTLAVHGGMQITQSVRWLKKNFLGFTVSEEHTDERVTFVHTVHPQVDARGRDRRRAEDLKLVYDTVRANLLMNDSEDGTKKVMKYVAETVIQHER